MIKERARKGYIYLKRGRSEISLFLTLYITWRTSVDSFQLIHLGYLIGLLAGALVLGWFATKKLDTGSQFTNPWTQDYIRYRVHLCEGLILLAEEKNQEAYLQFIEGQKIMSTWLDKPTVLDKPAKKIGSQDTLKDD